MTTIEAGSTINLKNGKSFRVEKTDPKARLSPVSVRRIGEGGEPEGNVLGITWDVLNQWLGKGRYAVK